MNKSVFISLAMAASLLSACSSEQEMAGEPKPPAQEKSGEGVGAMTEKMVAGPLTASASLKATEGNSVSGLIEFMAMEGGVQVSGELSGLTPGEHGFHVHEKGDCSAPDGSSAGGHFNPAGHDHAGPDADMQHMGDMGNIEAGDDGKAKISAQHDFLVLDPTAEDTIIGKAVIVHGGADDLSSQPSGAAGPRVACGVIQVAQ